MTPSSPEELAAAIVEQLQSDPELRQAFAQLDERMQSELIGRLLQEHLARQAGQGGQLGTPAMPEAEIGLAAPPPTATSVAETARDEAERMLGIRPEEQEQGDLFINIIENIIGSFTPEETAQLGGQAIVDAIRRKISKVPLPGWQGRAISLVANIIPVAMRAMVASARGKDTPAEIGRGIVEQAFAGGMAGLMTRLKQPKADTARLVSIIRAWFPEAMEGASAEAMRKSPKLVRESLGPLYYGSEALNEAMRSRRQAAFEMVKGRLGLAPDEPLLVDVTDVFRKFGDKIEANFGHLMPGKRVIDAPDTKLVKLPIEEADELLSAIIHYTQGAGRLAESRSPTQVHLTQSVAKGMRDSLSSIIEAALSVEPRALTEWSEARAKQFAWHTLRRLTGVESKPALALGEQAYWSPAITQQNIREFPALARQFEGTKRYDPALTQALVRAIYRGAPALSQDVIRQAYLHTWMHPKIGSAPITGLSFNPLESGRVFRRIRGTPDFRAQLPWGVGFAVTAGAVTPRSQFQPIEIEGIEPPPATLSAPPQTGRALPVLPPQAAPSVMLSPEEWQYFSQLAQTLNK